MAEVIFVESLKEAMSVVVNEYNGFKHLKKANSIEVINKDNEVECTIFYN